MVILYAASARQKNQENPFTRKYPTGLAEIDQKFDLRNRTMYFLGAEAGKIYVGDSQAPLHVFEIDSLLKSKRHYKIKLDNDKFSFSRVQLRVMPPYFYVLDGSVPVIFRGTVDDWKAKVVWKESKLFFTHAEILDDSLLATRSFTDKGIGTEIGKIKITDITYDDQIPNFLQKQVDGYFDVDGIMRYDSKAKQFIYLYYYRNQFIVADENLKIRYRGNTIDTNSVAKLKISYNKDTGLRQMASPSILVNRLMAVANNKLYVNSSVRGQNESSELWSEASAIDVYDLYNGRYLHSFYVHKFGESVTDIMVSGPSLYAIVGHHLYRYNIHQN